MIITIQEPNPFVVSTLFTQQVEAGLNYVKNPYVIADNNIWYNTLTDEIIVTDDSITERQELIKRWFYISDLVDPSSLSYLIHQKRLARKTKDSKSVNFVIFTTTACNASCPYCFEKGYKTLTMNEQTASDVADYIRNNRVEDKKIRLGWFGGEPLVNKKAINICCTKLHDYGVEFYSAITTNGYLLSTCSDDELKLWNLKKVQLTLDSIGDEYSRIKGLPNGAYIKLKDQIKRLEELKIRVNIRIHYNPKHNSDICFKIIDEFKGYTNVNMYARLLYDNFEKEYYEEVLRIDDAIYNVKKNNPKIMQFGLTKHCMADGLSKNCITPEGKLTVCEHFAYGENIYGSIYDVKVNSNILEKWSQKEKYSNTNCKKCSLYPLCTRIVMCPAEGKCSDGYQYYQIETIKRALRKKVEAKCQ